MGIEYMDMDHPIHSRKNKHLETCLDRSADIESQSSHLSKIHILPTAFPECSRASVDTTSSFAGSQISMPLIILPMTGGTHLGRQLNEVLYEAACECSLPIGLGSMRALLEGSSGRKTFIPKRKKNTTPIIANIGAIELKRHSIKHILHCCDELGADVLSLHINVAQELVQKGGDTDFSAILPKVHLLKQESPIPLLVKEAGFGIDPDAVQRLSEIEVDYIDISGSGGSNWAMIEAKDRGKEISPERVEFFRHWGCPTGTLLRLMYEFSQPRIGLEKEQPLMQSSLSLGSTRLVASGGVRTVHDMAVCLASGASYVGMALPLIRLAAESGVSGVIAHLHDLQQGLQDAMLVSGITKVADMPTCITWCDADLEIEVKSLLAAYGRRKQRHG